MDPVEPWIDTEAVRRMAAQLVSHSKSAEIDDRLDAGYGPGFEGFIGSEGESSASSSRPPTLPRDLAPKDPEPEPQPPEPEPQPPEPEVKPTAPAEPVPPRTAPALSVEPEVANSDLKENLPPLDDIPVLGVAPEIPPPVKAEKPSESKPEPIVVEERRPAIQVPPERRGPLVARLERFREWMVEKGGARGVFILDREGNAVLDDPNFGKLHFLARSLAQAYRPVEGKPGNVHVKVGSQAYLVVIPVETTFGWLVLGSVLPEPLDAQAVDLVSKAVVMATQPESR